MLTGRLRWWLLGGMLLLSVALISAALMATHLRAQRDHLQAWVPSASGIPAWNQAMAGTQPRWQVTRPTAESIQVETQREAGDASFYALALRERDATGATVSYAVFLAAQTAQMDGEQRELEVGEQSMLVVDPARERVVALARRERALVVVDASGLPRPPTAVLEEALAAALERILRSD